MGHFPANGGNCLEIVCTGGDVRKSERNLSGTVDVSYAAWVREGKKIGVGDLPPHSTDLVGLGYLQCLHGCQPESSISGHRLLFNHPTLECVQDVGIVALYRFTHNSTSRARLRRPLDFV